MYLFEISSMIVIAAISGVWWLYDDLSQGIFTGAFGLLMLYALAYETGYKIAFKKRKARVYFYTVFIFPCIVATLGFLYGVFRFYILPPS